MPDDPNQKKGGNTCQPVLRLVLDETTLFPMPYQALLPQLIASGSFRAEVAALIVDQVMEREAHGFPGGASTLGTIVDYELTAPIVFGPPEGGGLRWRVPFESRGVASGQCKTSESEDYTWSRDGALTGILDLELPEDAVQLGEFEEIVDGTLLDVLIEEVAVDDQSPSPERPEKFAGEA